MQGHQEEGSFYFFNIPSVPRNNHGQGVHLWWAPEKSPTSLQKREGKNKHKTAKLLKLQAKGHMKSIFHFIEKHFDPKSIFVSFLETIMLTARASLMLLGQRG